MKSKTLLQITPSSDKPMWDIWMSMWHLAVVTVADEIGLFKYLSNKQMTIESVARCLDLHPRPMGIIIVILIKLGFLIQKQHKLSLSSVAKTYLLERSPFYWGAQLLPLREKTEHKRIIDTLYKNSYMLSHNNLSITQMWEEGTITPEAALSFTQEMHATIFGPALQAIKKGIFASTHNLLDMGGGSGCFSIAYSEKYPQREAKVFELPVVAEITKQYLKKFNATKKVKVISGNFFKDNWPGGHDGILFSQIFHDWTIDNCKMLAKKAYESLAPGGKIFLHEMLLNKSRNSPLATACFDLFMFINHRSQQFTKDELFDLLKGVGFKKPKAVETFGYYSVVFAIK